LRLYDRTLPLISLSTLLSLTLYLHRAFKKAKRKNMVVAPQEYRIQHPKLSNTFQGKK